MITKIPQRRVNDLAEDFASIDGDTSQDFSMNDATISGDINASGDAVFNGNVNTSGDAAISGNASIDGDIEVGGSVRGDLFEGYSVGAFFADIAEKYTCENELPVGTVVSIAVGSEYEVEATQFELCERVVGVKSDNPGFILNKDANGQAIGLLGKMPVRIVGHAYKGDAIVPAGNGCARRMLTADEIHYKIGICLENTDVIKEKLVKCFIRR